MGAGEYLPVGLVTDCALRRADLSGPHANAAHTGKGAWSSRI
jgi:hypothetical protein